MVVLRPGLWVFRAGAMGVLGQAYGCFSTRIMGVLAPGLWVF